MSRGRPKKDDAGKRVSLYLTHQRMMRLAPWSDRFNGDLRLGLLALVDAQAESPQEQSWAKDAQAEKSKD